MKNENPFTQQTKPAINKSILEELLINNIKENEKIEQKPVDAMHCYRKIGNQPAKIVIDSGAVSNIIS